MIHALPILCEAAPSSMADWTGIVITLLICAGTILSTVWIVGNRVGALITELQNINTTMGRLEKIVEKTVETQTNQTTQIALLTQDQSRMKDDINDLRGSGIVTQSPAGSGIYRAIRP